MDKTLALRPTWCLTSKSAESRVSKWCGVRTRRCSASHHQELESMYRWLCTLVVRRSSSKVCPPFMFAMVRPPFLWLVWWVALHRSVPRVASPVIESIFGEDAPTAGGMFNPFSNVAVQSLICHSFIVGSILYINGSSFGADASVANAWIGSQICKGIKVLSDSLISCIVPTGILQPLNATFLWLLIGSAMSSYRCRHRSGRCG